MACTATLLRLFAQRTSAAVLPFVATALIASHGFAYELTYVPISTDWPVIVSLDYFEPTNNLVAAANYPNGLPHNFRKIGADGTQSQYTSVSGLTEEVKVATARSPEFGGFAGSPFAPGTMFAGRGGASQIVKIDPNGTVTPIWSTMPNGATAGRFWGLQVDRTGVFGGDLIGATMQGYIYRINGAGVATQLASTGSLLQSLTVVPNDPLTFGGMAGKILVGSEGNSRLYYCDAAGNWGYWSVPVAIDDLEMIPPNENFFGDNYGAGKLFGVTADQFESQGLVGKILVAKEFVGLYALTWDFGTNAPHFEQINTAPGSPVPIHWEDVTFAPAGVAEIRTVLPTPDYRVSGAFGIVNGIEPVPIPSPGSAITRYAYNGTTDTGNPPEARNNQGVISVVEDYKGTRSLMIVLDKTGDATGGSLHLQMTGLGADLASSFAQVQDDAGSDNFAYSGGTGTINWTWAAGQTDGTVLTLPFARPTSDPLSPWSIEFSTLSFTGLDGFVFLANGQEIDLGTGGFNFTLEIPEPLPGDYNLDDIVDAADYTVWRNHLDENIELPNEDDTPGVVDEADYDVWKAHYGESVGGAGGSAVTFGDASIATPEPASLAMLLLSGIALVAIFRR